MDFFWLIQYIIFPVAIFIYYLTNTQKHEQTYQLIKSIWYFYYAIATFFAFIGEESITSNDIVGFTIALALFEGLPGFIKIKILEIKNLFDKNN